MTAVTRNKITLVLCLARMCERSSRWLLQQCRQFAIVAIATAGQFGSIELVAAEPVPATWLTGPKFQQELGQPFPASWTFADLRQITKDVIADRRVSIVIDRRLDPSAQFPFATKNVSLKTGLDELASIAKGHVCVLGNVVFLGPESATRRLRTLIELRNLELQSKPSRIPDRRRSELVRHRKFTWIDLQTPREILDVVTGPLNLKIANADVIPHDLWAGATLPDTTVVEALSVILIQFDLTFRLTDSGASIELVPIPESLAVERKHPSKLKPNEAIALIHEKFPDLDAKILNAEVVVNGLVEDHEAVTSLLRGDSPSRAPKTEQSHPIRQRMFTLSLEQPVPLSLLMKKLEESDIHFEYNAEELKAAGIDLEKTIQLDVKNQPATEFFKSMFGPAGLEFQIDRQTVTLKPKRRATSNP